MTSALTEMDWVEGIRSDALTPLFEIVTRMGNGTFVVLFLAVAYWTGNKRAMARVGAMVTLAALLIATLKHLFADPRPTTISHLIDAHGFGFPSGHAFVSVVLWVGLALEVRRRWAWFVLPLVALLIGFSRIYLGVHDLEDVLGGFGFGLALVGAFVATRPLRQRLWQRLPWPAQVGAVVVATAVWLLVFFADELPDDALAGAAIFAGFWSGIALERRRDSYRRPDGWPRRVAIVAVGGLGALLIGRWLGEWLGAAGVAHPALGFALLTLLGLWMAWLAPLVFQRLRLAD